MKKKLWVRIATVLLVFVMSFSIVAGTQTASVEAASKSINMNIFKKKSVRKYLQNISYCGDSSKLQFANTKQLKKNLATLVRRDFAYVKYNTYSRYEVDGSDGGTDYLVPKSVLHKYIKNTYGLNVKNVSLPKKNGKYWLKEPWYQDAKEMEYYKAVKTKTGATITLKAYLFGRYVGKETVKVKKASNSMGFVITYMKYSKATTPTFSVCPGSTGSNKLAMGVTCSAGGTISYKSSNTGVATVNSNGVITAKCSGTATITASVKYNNKTYSVSRTVTVKSKKSYGAWSSWSFNAASSSSTQEVRTATFYRYYCFLCPVCGGREPLQGMSDCHQYSLTLNNAVTTWSTVPYSSANSAAYSYATYKRYTFSLGDGKRWNFSTGNINDHAIGTKDTDSTATVIRRGYSTRSVSTSYYISAIG